MPVVSITLEEHNRSVLEQTYYKIIDDIIKVIKIPHDALVILHKDKDITKTDSKANVGKNNMSNLEKDNLPTTASRKRIVVNISEEYNEDSLAITEVHQVAAYPIFQDTDVNLFIFPIYVTTDITIEFSYISPSKSEANRIRDDIRLRLAQSRNITIHDVEYDILLPDVIETFITDIYDIKNRLVPQTLETYFEEHSTNRMHLLTDLANPENAKLAIRERQIRIVGLFDFTPMPDKIEADNELNNYKLSFTYKLSLDIPKAIGINYPVIMCNTVLPSKYIKFIADDKENSMEESNRNLAYTKSLYALSHFESHLQLENRVNIKLPVNIPLFDDFTKKVIHKGYAVIVSLLTNIDETDNRTLLNLRDLDPYHISSELLDFILATEKDFIVHPYMSFLYIGLWQDDTHYDNDILTIDNDLTVKSKVDLKLFKPTRILISINIDIAMLNDKTTTRLLNNPKILNIYLSEYMNAITNFKAEQSYRDVSILNFFRFVILAISKFKDTDNITAINEVLNIVNSDEYLFANTMSIMKNKYPDTYLYLVTNNIVDKNTTFKGYTLFTDNSTLDGKTVMLNYVIALNTA